MARTDFIENDRVLVTNRNGTSFRGLLSQLVTYIGSFLRPYKVYTALLSQTGTDAPTAVVLENTLGGVPVWTRYDEGKYRCTLSGTFTANKTFFSYSKSSSNYDLVADEGARNMAIGWEGANSFIFSQASSSAVFLDEISQISIEIRVYN